MQVYPHYRDPDAVKQLNPHLHNVPLQIAAERGLPALATWLWFIVALVRDLLAQGPDLGVPVARRPRRSPRSSRCWRPGCSNTTSATPSS